MKKIVISLGGSLIFPEEINVEFLKKFKDIINSFIEEGNKVVIVTGGGKICRKYNQAARELLPQVSDKELDWMGIKATKVNAELVRIMFEEKAYYKVLDRPDEEIDLEKDHKPVFVAGGWKPGASSDNMAVMLAKTHQADSLINLTNIDYVYESDPKENPEAKSMEKLAWAEYLNMVGSEWSPGANYPFDPIASKNAQEIGLKVYIVNGENLANLSDLLQNKSYLGTELS